MAAGPYKRGQGWQIKWRENGRNGPWETEFFRDEREARIFKMDVEMAGNRWPEGWIPGRGYMTDAELAAEEEAEADNCTPFLPFAMRRIEDLRAARTIDQDTMRRYTQYAKAFAADAIQAEALAEVLAADDDLRHAFLDEYTSIAGTLESLEVSTQDDICIEDVDTDTITAWVNLRRVRGSSTKTIRNHHGFLHGVFEEATDRDLLPRNPCAKTKLGANVPVRTKVILEPEEFDLIHEAMKPDMKDFVYAAVGIGARFGELTALTVADWHPARQTLAVQKAWKKGRSGHYVGKPKTTAGFRQVPVGDAVAEMLDRHCHGREPGDLIFTAPRGGRIRQNVFGTDRWHPALKVAHAKGLSKQPRFHDLRHTHISWLRDAGLPDAAIKDLVGHAGEEMTSKYGGVTKETIARANVAINHKLVR